MTPAELTLPGTIPGLLRRGSPVPHPRAADVPCAVVAVGARALIGYPWPVNDEHADSWPLSDLDLDLTDATGRAHAAWWVAIRRCRDPQPLSALWRSLGVSEERPSRGARWGLDTADHQYTFCTWWAPRHEFNVPAFGDLDPDDARLLVDGSRWVDAQALRLVVLQVAGVTP